MNILNRHNVQLRTKGGIYKLDEVSIIEKYKSGMTCEQISQEYNVCLKTICNTLEKNGAMKLKLKEWRNNWKK